MSDMIDEATAKNSAGVHWDQAKFEAAKDNNGCISSEQFEKEALQLQLEIRNQQSQTLEKSMEGTFHRRELKAPAIAFSSSVSYSHSTASCHCHVMSCDVLAWHVFLQSISSL